MALSTANWVAALVHEVRKKIPVAFRQTKLSARSPGTSFPLSWRRPEGFSLAAFVFLLGPRQSRIPSSGLSTP